MVVDVDAVVVPAVDAGAHVPAVVRAGPPLHAARGAVAGRRRRGGLLGRRHFAGHNAGVGAGGEV